MTYVGDVAPGTVIRHFFNTNAVAGESITRATDGTISVYKDGGTTQSTTGVSSTEDFDSLTGVHLVTIDTSADGTFYSTGSDFHVVLSAATIDGKTINAYLFSFSLNNRTALRPTTAGRTLDVSAGGEAGIDWANVGSPTTTVGLSGTTVKTATDVDTDTADIQTRLPAALVSGRIDSSVGAVASGAITATAIAADAIGASELAADAVAEIADAIWDEARAGHVSAGTFGEGVASVQGSVTGSVGSVTGAIASVTGSVGSVATGGIAATSFAAGAIDAAALAADAGTEIGTAVWATGTRALTDKAGFSLSSAGIQAIWDALTSALTTVGSIGKLLVDNVNATISSRASQTSLDTVDDFLDTEVAAIKTQTDQLVFSGSRVDATVGAMQANVLTASALASDAVDEILDDTIGDSTITVRQALRVLVAGMAGKLSGAATTTVTIRNVADSANVIVATVDSDGNRSAVTVTP